MKDCESPPPFSLAARVVETGDLDDQGKPVTTLVMEPTDAVPVKAKAAGSNQEKAIGALKEWARGNPNAKHITSEAIRDTLKAHGLRPNRRAEVLTYLVNIRALTASIGGYTIDRAIL
jgi:hypothetical protein